MLKPRHILTLLCLLLCAGCGLDDYEMRLRQTNAFFEYREKLDINLESSIFTLEGFKWRVPRGFKIMAAPGPQIDSVTNLPLVNDETGQVIMSEDKRQPGRIDLGGGFKLLTFQDLDGIVAAWRTDLNVDARTKSPVLLYLLSNHQRHRDQADGAAVDPTALVQDIEIALQASLGITLNEGTQNQVTVNQRFAEPIPLQEIYAIKKNFTAVEFAPTDPNLSYLRVRLYGYEKGKDAIECAVVCIYPAALLDLRQVEDRLKLSLETLEVPTQRPLAKARGGSTNAAPGGNQAAPAPAF